MSTLAVLTSGGDAPGMNAAIRAVAKLGAARGQRVVGVELGYEGLIDGRFRELTRALPGGGLAAHADVAEIGGHGGTILGSARSTRFREPEGRAAAAASLRTLPDLTGLVVVGGNGSLAGAHALATEHGVPLVGVPASIDNDLGCTALAIGVDTALNTIVEAVDRIADTARAHRRAFIVEVMGRECGYLAMAASVAAGADGALFREQGRDEAGIVEAVTDAIAHAFTPPRDKKRFLVLKSEGVRMPCTKLVREVEARLAPRLEAAGIRGAGVRGVVLGHTVRGGRPSYQDRMLGGRLAFGAVGALERGLSDAMVAWNAPRDGGAATPDPYVRTFPLAEVLAETEALLDGTSPVTERRVRMMQAVEGALGL